MYRYKRDFGYLYRNPTISDTVSIASKWVYTDNRSLLKYYDRE